MAERENRAVAALSINCKIFYTEPHNRDATVTVYEDGSREVGCSELIREGETEGHCAILNLANLGLNKRDDTRCIHLHPSKLGLDREAEETLLLKDLLFSREMQVLQLAADGLTESETASTLGIAQKTVEGVRQSIGNIGFPDRARLDAYHTRIIMSALIIDGINTGCIKHEAPTEPIEPLTPKEYQVAELAATGMSNRAIASRLIVSTKTIDAHKNHTRRKLRADKPSHYFFVARFTYLKNIGMVKVYDGNRNYYLDESDLKNLVAPNPHSQI